jgi:hypothetical protein
MTTRFIEWLCSNLALNFMQCSMGRWSLERRLTTMALSAVMISSGFLSFFCWSPLNVLALTVSISSFFLVVHRISSALLDAQSCCLHPDDVASVAVCKKIQSFTSSFLVKN